MVGIRVSGHLLQPLNLQHLDTCLVMQPNKPTLSEISTNHVHETSVHKTYLTASRWLQDGKYL